jgi:hypothetical protein
LVVHPAKEFPQIDQRCAIGYRRGLRVTFLGQQVTYKLLNRLHRLMVSVWAKLKNILETDKFCLRFLLLKNVKGIVAQE